MVDHNYLQVEQDKKETVSTMMIQFICPTKNNHQGGSLMKSFLNSTTLNFFLFIRKAKRIFNLQ